MEVPYANKKEIEDTLKPMYEGIEVYKQDAEELVDRVKRLEESTLLDEIYNASYEIVELAHQKYHQVPAEHFWEEEILDGSENPLRKRLDNLNNIPNINTYIKELEDIKKILINWVDVLKSHSDYKSDWVKKLQEELEVFAFSHNLNKKYLIVIFDVSSSADLQKIYNGKTIQDLLSAYIFPIFRKMDGELWEVDSGVPNKITPLKELSNDIQFITRGGGGTNFDDAFSMLWERTLKQPDTEFMTIIFTDSQVSWDTELMPSNLLIVTENEKQLPELNKKQRAIIIEEEYAKGGVMAKGRKFTGMKDLHIDMTEIVDNMTDKEVADYLKISHKEFNQNRARQRERAADKMTNNEYEKIIDAQEFRNDEKRGLAKGGILNQTYTFKELFTK